MFWKKEMFWNKKCFEKSVLKKSVLKKGGLKKERVLKKVVWKKSVLKKKVFWEKKSVLRKIAIRTDQDPSGSVLIAIRTDDQFSKKSWSRSGPVLIGPDWSWSRSGPVPLFLCCSQKWWPRSISNFLQFFEFWFEILQTPSEHPWQQSADRSSPSLQPLHRKWAWSVKMQVFRPWTPEFVNFLFAPWATIHHLHQPWTRSGRGASKTRQNAGFSSLDSTV